MLYHRQYAAQQQREPLVYRCKVRYSSTIVLYRLALATTEGELIYVMQSSTLYWTTLLWFCNTRSRHGGLPSSSGSDSPFFKTGCVLCGVVVARRVKQDDIICY